MKSKDLPMIIFIAAVSAGFSVALSRFVFASQKNLTTRVEVVDPISGEFNYEDKPYFTADAINPTRDITVDENNNPSVLTK